MNIKLDENLKAHMKENNLKNILISSMMCHT